MVELNASKVLTKNRQDNHLSVNPSTKFLVFLMTLRYKTVLKDNKCEKLGHEKKRMTATDEIRIGNAHPVFILERYQPIEHCIPQIVV